MQIKKAMQDASRIASGTNNRKLPIKTYQVFET